MLKHRIITALIVAPLFILAILFLPPFLFVMFSTLIVLGCAWEWSELAGLTSLIERIVYTLLFAGVIASTFIFPVMFYFMLVSTIYFLYFAGLVWVFLFASVLRYAKGKPNLGLDKKFVRLILGFFTLIPFWVSLIILQRLNNLTLDTLLIAFLLIWSVDIGAYFVGRRMGQHKLIARVSPNKTWEGFAGGLVLCVGVALVIGFCFDWSWQQRVAFVILGLLTGLFAVLGDLFESMLKRQAGLKDSGKLLPGHGGLLDRFDSAIAALPIFLLGMACMGAMPFGA